MPAKALTELTNRLVARLTSVVDEEEICHTGMCANMIALASAVPDDKGADTIMELVSDLQYFDRMQQRAHYFAKVIELSLATDGSVQALTRALDKSAARAPHKDDADWCRRQAATLLPREDDHVSS